MENWGEGDRDWPQGTQHPKLFLWLQVCAPGTAELAADKPSSLLSEGMSVDR